MYDIEGITCKISSVSFMNAETCSLNVETELGAHFFMISFSVYSSQARGLQDHGSHRKHPATFSALKSRT